MGCVFSYLVAFDQNPLHLFQQVLQIPAAQSLDDLHQRSSCYVTDLLEAVPQQDTDLDQDPGKVEMGIINQSNLLREPKHLSSFSISKDLYSSYSPWKVGLHDVRRQSLHEFDHGEGYRDPHHLLILHILRLHCFVLLVTFHLKENDEPNFHYFCW